MSTPDMAAPAYNGHRRRLWLFFVPLLLLLALMAGSVGMSGANAVADRLRPLIIPPLAECIGQRPVLTVGIFDVSSSVIGSGGADPNASSFTEFQAVIDALAASPCTPDDRVAALIFSGSTVEVPPTLVSSSSVAKTTIRRPPANEIGGSTNMTEAFDRARQLEERYDDYAVTFILLSDNQADDVERADSALELVRSPVHSIGLGQVITDLDGRFESVVHLDKVARADIGTAVVDIINRSR